MSRKRLKPVKFVSFIELSDDVDELLELLAQSESLHTQAQNEQKLRQSERALIKDKLKVLRQKYEEPHISDHSVVRYLERVVGVDIEACKKEMISKLPKDFKPSENVEFVSVTEANNLRYVIRDNLIISVTPVAPLQSS